MKNSVSAPIKYVSETPTKMDAYGFSDNDVNFIVGMNNLSSEIEYQQLTVKHSMPFIEKFIRKTEFVQHKMKYYPFVLSHRKVVAHITYYGDGTVQETKDMWRDMTVDDFPGASEDLLANLETYKETLYNALIEVDGSVYTVYVLPDNRKSYSKSKRKSK